MSILTFYLFFIRGFLLQVQSDDYFWADQSPFINSRSLTDFVCFMIKNSMNGKSIFEFENVLMMQNANEDFLISNIKITFAWNRLAFLIDIHLRTSIRMFSKKKPVQSIKCMSIKCVNMFHTNSSFSIANKVILFAFWAI